jgi:hypothetical protein
MSSVASQQGVKRLAMTGRKGETDANVFICMHLRMGYTALKSGYNKVDLNQSTIRASLSSPSDRYPINSTCRLEDSLVAFT